MDPLQPAAKMMTLLTSAKGLPQSQSALAEFYQGQDVQFGMERVVQEQVAAELAERSTAARYPALYVYCERLENTGAEKFQRFSGSADAVIEVRASSERVERVNPTLIAHVQAVTDTLERSRGDLGDGVHLTGRYEVSFQPVRKGGSGYLQTAKIVAKLAIGRD